MSRSDNSETKFRIIGKSRVRVDALSKVTGKTQFADDIKLPRMLHCKLLRSHVPHATIESIDLSAARAHPGVHLVLSGADFPVEYGILPVSQDERPLCRDKSSRAGWTKKARRTKRSTMLPGLIAANRTAMACCPS